MPVQYISTRGEAAPVDFLTACLAGLAPDGGLYVPAEWPRIDLPKHGALYTSIAADILLAFAGNSLSRSDIQSMCDRAYAAFAHQSVAPLTQIGPSKFMMELYHGPTLAFKDVAMQLIGQIFEHALKASGDRMTIICATSGDTGGAAAAAFAGLDQVDLVILHPNERVSPVQRQFMTSTGASNVLNLAVESDFDDCQAMVKSLFADTEFAGDVRLSGVNSINWARIAAQSVYYAAAQASFGADVPLRFIVPSGNMGDALAGYVAARCGLLSGFDLVCAVNENDALARVFSDKRLDRQDTVETPSPAMDITVPSNLERVLFEASARDGDAIRQLYANYAQSGHVELPAQISGPLSCMGLSAIRVNNGDTLNEIERVRDLTGWLICPHTAVGTAVLEQIPGFNGVDIVLATAHAAKFPETVEKATGHHPELPRRCVDALAEGEVFEVIENDLVGVRRRIEAFARQ